MTQTNSSSTDVTRSKTLETADASAPAETSESCCTPERTHACCAPPPAFGEAAG